MFSESILNNEGFTAIVIDSINKHINRSNINSSMNLNMEKVIQDIMGEPLCEQLVFGKCFFRHN